jgi:hypothetical protein
LFELHLAENCGVRGRPLNMSWQGLSKVSQIFLHPSDLFAHTKPNYIQSTARLRPQPFVFAGWLGGWIGCSCQITDITCKNLTVTQLIKNALHMTTAMDIITPLSPLCYTVPEGKSISTIRCKERKDWTLLRSPDTSCYVAVLRISHILKKQHPWRFKRSMKTFPDPSTTEDKGTLFLQDTEKH